MLETHEAHQAKLTQEERAKNRDLFLALMADPAKGAQAKEEGEATQKAADADGDGALNWAEFLDLTEKGEANMVAKGWTVPPRDEELIRTWFDKFCEWAGTPDKISLESMTSMQTQMMIPLIAKRQAEAAQ